MMHLWKRSAGLSTKPRCPLSVVGRVGFALAIPALVIPALVAVAPGASTTAGASTTPATDSVMPLQEFVNDDAGGHLWNAYNQTANASGPTIVGRPSAVLNGASVYAFVRAANGDLTEYTNDNAHGQLWNAYDVTHLSGGSAITSDPAAVLISPTSFEVFAEATNGNLVEFSGSAGSQSWTTTNLSQATFGAEVAGDPSAVMVGSALDVFAQSPAGHLVEFSGTPGGPTWTLTDLTAVSTGPMLGGDPFAVVYGASQIHVYGLAANDDLTEFVNDGAGGRAWNAYDLTTGAAGPSASGRPSAIVYGKTVHVYVRAASGDLTEFVNDDAGGRLWNSYDLTKAANGPAIVGDPGAILYGAGNVQVYVQATSGDLTSFINDDAGGRLWNSYDQTQYAGGLMVGTDPDPIVYGSTVHVYVGGPPPSQQVAQVVALAEGADQNNAAVVETPPGSNCNPYTAYFGRGSSVGCAPGTSAEEWCSDFAQWVWTAAGIPTTGIDGWSYSFVTWGQAHAGAWQPGDDNNPQAGDAVIWGDLSSTYGVHVGIVVGVSQGMIDVVSGNAGPPIDAQGDVDAVWDSGYFDPTTSTVAGYPIIGYVAPVGWGGVNSHALSASLHALTKAQLKSRIAKQDGGK
jgi:hypothetical protein